MTFAACLAAAYTYDKFVVLPHLIFEIVKILVVMTVFVVVYVPLNLVMKIDYARELAVRVSAKFKR